MSTAFDDEAASVSARIPAGPRVAVIGSTSFWHEASARTCDNIGKCLADLDGVLLLTGGVTGVGERVGRAYADVRARRGRTPGVIHVLPRGYPAWDYGTTLFAGDDMSERREILGRLAGTFVVVEGGPGTAHEATVAAAHGAVLIPVASSGGHAGALYPQLERPPMDEAAAWKVLVDPQATSRTIARAVAEIVDRSVRRGL